MIAIAGGKGGCGKTTTTLGFSRRLVRRGVPVRAIDLDRGMPDLHRLAGVDRDPTLTDAIEGPECVACAAGRTDAGVEVVPAPRTTADLDLQSALRRVARAQGATLLDCPAGAGPAAVAPLRSADAVVLVTTAREESLEDATKTATMVRSLETAVLGVVVTGCDSVPDRIASALGTDRIVPVPQSSSPLSDPMVAKRYDRVADWIARPRSRRAVERRP